MHLVRQARAAGGMGKGQRQVGMPMRLSRVVDQRSSGSARGR
jgi:hypothetical protein